MGHALCQLGHLQETGPPSFDSPCHRGGILISSIERLRPQFYKRLRRVLQHTHNATAHLTVTGDEVFQPFYVVSDLGGQSPYVFGVTILKGK